MLRPIVLMAIILLAAPAVADDKDWTGRSIKLKEGVALGRKLGGGLVRDGAVLDKTKTYVVKSDDGAFLELVGETGFIFKSEAEVVRAVPAPADPIVGSYRWYSGAEFVFRENGTATAKLNDKTWAVRWVVNPYGGYVLMYDDGGVDVVKLSKDAAKLEGTGLNSGKSYPVSGTRR